MPFLWLASHLCFNFNPAVALCKPAASISSIVPPFLIPEIFKYEAPRSRFFEPSAFWMYVGLNGPDTDLLKYLISHCFKHL